MDSKTSQLWQGTQKVGNIWFVERQKFKYTTDENTCFSAVGVNDVRVDSEYKQREKDCEVMLPNFSLKMIQ